MRGNLLHTAFEAAASTEMIPAIHHGTPFTPRAALLDVLAGRDACVSFYYPQDAEVVAEICRLIMFRQRSVFGMDGGHQARGVLVHSRGLATLLRLARGEATARRHMGSHSRCTRSAKPAQRCAAKGVAVRCREGGSALAHGWSDLEAWPTVRDLPPRGPWMDRPSEIGASRLRWLPPTHGRGRRVLWLSLARFAHDARYLGGSRLPLCERRRDQCSAEWTQI